MDERRLTPATQIKPEAVSFLWPHRVPLGAITIMDGDPGQGKSSVMYDFAARVSAGKPAPNSTGHPSPGGVLLLQAEDSASATLLTLRAMGADLERIRIYDRQKFRPPLVLPSELHVLESAASDVQASLVVIDPLTAFVAGWASNDVSIRRSLAPLVEFAERRRLAVVLVRHLIKGGRGGNVIHRGAGGIGIIGTARSGLLVWPSPGTTDKHEHVLIQTKTNLSSAVSLRFRTVRVGDAILVEWLGESAYSAADLVECGSGNEPHSAIEEAKCVLCSLLSEGEVLAKEIIKAAASAGVSKRTLDRAKRELRVRRAKHGNGAGSYWTWWLPDDPAIVQRYRERDAESAPPAQSPHEAARAQFEQPVTGVGATPRSSRPLLDDSLPTESHEPEPDDPNNP